jgi:hypothetical protein
MQKSIRLVSLKLGSNPESVGVIRQLRNLIPDVQIFGVGEALDERVTDYDFTITSHYDALFGRYQQFPLPQIPVSPELHALVAPFEGRVMAMLDRIALNPVGNYPPPIDGVPRYRESYEARADLFYRHCRFWYHIFEHFGIDALIAQNFGHQGYDETAICLARALGIPTLIFNDSTTLPFVQFVQEDVSLLGDLRLGLTLKNSVQSEMIPESHHFAKKHLTTTVKRPDRFAIKPSDFETSIFSSWLVDNNVRVSGALTKKELFLRIAVKAKRLLRSPFSSVNRLRVKVPRYLATKRAQREEALYIRPSPSGKYLYFPLNFQPEASTSVKGRHFYRLREAVSFVASELPPEFTLVVKEHPHQLRRHFPRALGFFAQLAAIPRVTLVSHATDNEALVARSAAICTVAHSSLSAHALFTGKPVICLGHSNFKEAPNFFEVDSTASLRAAIYSVTSSEIGAEPTKSLSDYFTKIENSTFEGVLGYRPPDVTEDEYRRLVQVTSKNLGLVIASWLRMKFAD